MQIVIDINEDVYTRLFDSGIQDNEIAVDDVCKMARALRLGRPLETRPQPCEDCISREAVIEHICENKECYKEECNGRTLKWCYYLQWVFNLPPVTPQPKTEWIPVSERLPEEEGLYLVSVKNEHDRRYSKTCWFHGKNNWFARQDIEAWMPLPESYRGDKDGNINNKE